MRGAVAALALAFAAAFLTPASAADPRDTFYSDVRAGNDSAAIAAAAPYVKEHPNDDRFALDYTYALLRLHDAGADALLAHLAASAADPAIRTAAQREIDARRAPAAASSAYAQPRFENFDYSEYGSRFGDIFYGADARYRFVNDGRFSVYAVSHLTNDTRSGAPGASDIYNDNAFIIGAGTDYRITPHLRVFAESGEAINIKGGHSQTDLRAGLVGGTTIAGTGGKPRTDAYAGVARYSRYLDTIAYGSISHEMRLGDSPLRAIAGADAVLDTSRLYYNNAAEVFGGLAWREKNVTLRFVAQAGRYLDRAPYTGNRSYTSIEPQIWLSFSR